MTISIDAVYEEGVFRPLSPLPNLKEHEKVKLTVETPDIISQQRQNRLNIDPAIAREIGDSHEFDLLEK